MNTLFDYARDMIRERFPLIFLGKPALTSVPAGTVLGGSVWSKLHVARWIVIPALHLGAGVVQTDLARAWIELNTTLPLRRKRDDRPPAWAPLPLRARRGVYDDAVYVDIVSTYRAFLSAVGYDVEYRRLAWLGQGHARGGLDQLDKVAYSAIVALSARRSKVVAVTTRAGTTTQKTITNKYANECLFALVRDVLHCIYSDVVDAVDVFYANTDGFIVHERDARRVSEVIGEWGLAARVKSRGRVLVRGTGSYCFDALATARVSTRDIDTPLADERLRAWLRTRFAAAASARE